MKRLVYQVAVGPVRPLWRTCVDAVAAYCRRHDLVHVVQTSMVLRVMPEKSCRSEGAVRLGGLPNLEKLAGLDRLGEFDQIALVDADVYPMPGAGNIFDDVRPGVGFAACIEREMPITALYSRKLDRYARGQYGDPKFPFFNCGVEVFTEAIRPALGGSVREFLKRPEFVDLINGLGEWRWSSEQTLMNVFVRSGPVVWQALPWKWNALYGMLESIEGAQFVHFLLSEHLESQDVGTLLRTNGRKKL
jgi:hypothetical protein